MESFYYIIIIIVIFIILKSSCKKVEKFVNDCDTFYKNYDDNDCYDYDYNTVQGCKVIENELKWNEGSDDYEPDKWCEECGKLDKLKKKNNCNCSQLYGEYSYEECKYYNNYDSVETCKENEDEEYHIWCEDCNDIISEKTNCEDKTSNDLFKEIIKKTKKSDTFTKVTFSISKAYADKIELNMWPIKMYFENEKYYIGDKGESYFFTFDDNQDNLIYNYESNFRHKFLQTIYLDFENTTFCKKKCKLEIHLFDYLIFDYLSTKDGKKKYIGEIGRTMLVKNLDNNNFSDLDLYRIVEIYRDKYLDKDGIRHEMYDYKNKTQLDAGIYIPLKFGNKYLPLCNQYTGNYKMWGGTLIANNVAKKEKKKCLYETGCTYNHKECCPKYCKLKNGKISGKIDCRNCLLYYKNKEFVDNNGEGEQKNINWIDHHKRNLIFSKSLVDAVLLGDVNLVKRLIKEGADVNRIMHSKVALLQAINHVNIPIIKEILKVKNVKFKYENIHGFTDALEFALQRLKKYRNSSFDVQKETARQFEIIALNMIDKGATIIFDHFKMDIDFFIKYKDKLKDKLKYLDSKNLFSLKIYKYIIKPIKNWRDTLMQITDVDIDELFNLNIFNIIYTINTDWIKKVYKFTNNKKMFENIIPIMNKIKKNLKELQFEKDNNFKKWEELKQETFWKYRKNFYKKYNKIIEIRNNIFK
jgi:hypothetical protein